MIQATKIVGPLACNCTLLACEQTKEAVIIDPGDDPAAILKMVEDHGVKVKYLLHTHAHFDHIGATGKIKDVLKAQGCLHRGDEVIYNNLPMQGQMFGFHFEAAPPIDKFIEDEEVLSFGKHQIKVIHTPGHSPGGVCFSCEEAGKVFSGDTLFYRSIGRSDLWGGDGEELLRSIRRRLWVLDDDTTVFPGHGPKTLVGEEKRMNPYLA